MYNIVFKSKKKLNLNLLTVEIDNSCLISIVRLKFYLETHRLMIL